MKIAFWIMFAVWVTTINLMIWIGFEKKSLFSRVIQGRRRKQLINEISDNFEAGIKQLLDNEEAKDKRRSMNSHPTASFGHNHLSPFEMRLKHEKAHETWRSVNSKRHRKWHWLN